MKRNEGNIILSSLNDVEMDFNRETTIPEGYIEVRLSTKGRVGAPKVIHVRNFKVKDIVALSLTQDSSLPAKLISILNDMIYEDVDVALWHEKEVEELMVYIYSSFYKDVLMDVDFPLTEEDIQELLKKPNGKELVAAIKTGENRPKTDIVISQGVDTWDIEDDFTPVVTITNKKTGFNVTFDFIKYGDQIVIKKWLDSYFKEEEQKFKKVESALAYNAEVINQIKNNITSTEDLDYLDTVQLKEIPVEDQEAYDEFRTRKLQTLSEVVRIASIINYNGEDVSNISLTEKYERFADDPRIDYGMISKLAKRQEKMHFGIKPEVTMKNPITNKMCKRSFSFRLPIILSAIEVFGDSDYDDGYGDEDLNS